MFLFYEKSTKFPSAAQPENQNRRLDVFQIASSDESAAILLIKERYAKITSATTTYVHPTKTRRLWKRINF